MWLNNASGPSIVASPAGFQKMASTPVMSAEEAAPMELGRGPTWISSSPAPAVPLRSSEPAQAPDTASASRAARPSARMVRRIIVPSPFCDSCTVMVSLLEAVEPFFLGEHHDAADVRADLGRVHVEDIDPTADGKLVLGVEIPGEDRGRGIVLLQRSHELPGQVVEPDRAAFRQVHEPQLATELVGLVVRVRVVRVRNRPDG